MLEYLKTIGFAKKINISTIMAVYNKEAIRFMIDNYKINKIILSREVTIKEIEEIVKEFPEMQFEVFGEGDFCRYNNGLCFAEHKYGARDICTEILDDFEIKKTIVPEYKKLILNPELSQEDKLSAMNNHYSDPFEEISHIVDNLNYGLLDDAGHSTKRLTDLLKQNKDMPNLFYDGLQNFEAKRNKKILSYLK